MRNLSKEKEDMRYRMVRRKAALSWARRAGKPIPSTPAEMRKLMIDYDNMLSDPDPNIASYNPAYEPEPDPTSYSP